MDRSPLNLLGSLWAARIVEGYAMRARPEMSDGARIVLLHHLASRLSPVVADAPIGDWSETANAALDAWEYEAHTAGPRVLAFDDLAGIVRFEADLAARRYAPGARLPIDNRARTGLLARWNAWLAGLAS
jgi:hypothetical protein